MYFLWKESVFNIDFMKVWDTVTMFMYICLSKRPCQHIYKQECDIKEIKSVIGQEYYYLWLVKSITLCDWSRILLSVIGQEYHYLWLVKSITICDWSRVLQFFKLFYCSTFHFNYFRYICCKYQCLQFTIPSDN